MIHQPTNPSALLRSISVLSLFLIAFCAIGLQFGYTQCQQLVWSDEFDGPNIDLTKWEFQTGNGTAYGLVGGWGNNERQYYTSSTNNASIVGGKLNITARYEQNYLGSGYDYTSARLRSRGKGDWKYGRFEASIKVPVPYWDTRHWPAFWMLPYASNWPNTGEIDILETGANNEFWKYHGTIHYNCSPCPPPRNRNTGTGGVNIPAGTGIANDYDLSKMFHTYRVDWSPNLIEWYVDGIKIGQRVPADLTGTGGLASDWPFEAAGTNNYFHLILNMAVGGWFPGDATPNNSLYPLTMEVDWVRVYSSASATQITGESKILQGETKEYSVAPATGTYNWTVPSGATITSGQGTNKITVNYGTASVSGNVQVTITPGGSCVAATAILPVTVVPNACNVTLEDFETGGQRNLGYNFSTGWMNRPGPTSPSDPYGSFANPNASGVNTTSRVCKYERNAGVSYDVLAYNDIVLGNADHMEAGVMAFNMDVYTNAPVGTEVLIQLENRVNAQTGWPNGIHSRYRAVTTSQNAWNRLAFTLLDSPSANMLASEVDQIVILFSPNTNNASTYYFDNFRRVGTTPNTTAITGTASLCQNQAGVTYTVTGLAGSTYNWTVPSGTIVSGQGTNSIVVNFGTTGGNVTVVETSSVNCTGPTRTFPVTVTGSCVLNADFTASLTSVCAAQTVTFTDATTGKAGTETYSWNFGAGASLPAGTTGAGPHNVTYSTGGVKTVTLTVTRGATSDTETKTNYITVADPPVGCLFKDDYDNSTVSFVTNNAFSHTESGTAWRVSNAGHGEWEYFNYALNNGTTAMSLDFKCPANKPIVKIRAKASANCILRVTLGDENNKEAQNQYLQPLNTLELTTVYKDFTIDFRTMMWDQYNGGGQLDTTKINKLIFRVNPGYTSFPYVGTNGTYNTAFTGGTIDIDWIGMGDNCSQVASPTITNFTPSCVVPGTTSVTITGTNLTGATAVSFNGTAGTITGNTATQIVATVPTGATAGTITVTTPGGAATSTGSYTIAIVPSVSIAMTTGANPSCAGSSLTFTPTPTNGGTTPTYQWRVNGVNTTTGATFTSTTLANNDQVSCVMTSNAACVTTATATSNTITVNRTANVTPSVTIAISTGANPSCAGSSLTFTPTPTSGGTTPAYQWRVNGINTATGATFTSTTLANNDQVSCVMTSNITCVTSATATSNTITVNRTANVTPSVTIAITTGANPSCAGSSLTFTPTPTSGGTTPTYQWRVNGINTATSATFTSTTLANNDQVSCEMTSNAACVTTATATSNTLTINRTANVTPSVTIALTTGANPSCAGSALTFTPTPTSGGTTPTYQWRVNGINTTTGATFTSTTLANSDQVSCVMTSNETCVTSATATSNSITINRTANVTPSVTIALTTGANPSCAGSSLTFTPAPTNGGTTPTYQWRVNGINATTGTTFTSTTLANNDQVSCVMTSNETCVTSANATSNSITVNRTANVTPSVTIALTTGANPSCAGSSLTFTPTPTNGGTTPTYQWRVNGINTTIGATFTSATLANSDQVSCVMTSNATCVTSATATSNTITINRTANVTPSVSIALTTGTSPSCAGTSLTFTATPTNGGTTPTYQWSVNGINATTGLTFTSSALANNDQVTCVMTSNETCVTSASATSNTITINRTANVTPGVTIAITTGSNPSCAGSSLTFTATPTNGGTTPSYQWRVNGAPATTGLTFTSASLGNGDQVSCVMTSNATCVTSASATSNTITLDRTGNASPSVVIALTTGSNPSCAGSSLTFTPTPTAGGSTPGYQWIVNGINNSTGPTFTSTALSNGDQVSCVMTSSLGCVATSTATSNTITITRTANVTPSVNIAITSGSNPTCAGSSVTFTASPTNGGTTPSYQWKVNNTNVGSNSNTYTSTSLSNGQNVTCEMISNAGCVTSSTVTSNTISMTVNSVLTPSVSIAVTGGSNPVCTGGNVTFTATPVNQGAAPVFQWKVNGFNVGSNSATYSSTALSNGDIVTCQLTSNATCASPVTATSNGITMTVNSTQVPSVTISITSGSNPSCTGSSLTFTPSPTNGGGSPTYQWIVNGFNTSTGNTFTSSTLGNNDQVSCVMTSNSTCASPLTATSNTIIVNRSTTVAPSVSIAVTSGSNPACAGSSVTFTASPVNGGTTPSFQWRVNGGSAGTNSSAFTTNTLTSGDVVSCEMTSNSACASPLSANSNTISMTINPVVTPSVSIAVTGGANPTCAGNSVTFTATPVQGGLSPSYQWKVNNTSVGSNSTMFSSNSLVNGDQVSCTMISSATCPSTAEVNSSAITMTVNSIVTPAISVNITSGSNPTCSGSSVTFTASATHSGTTPVYQWMVNGDNVGTNGTTYSSSALVNGDQVTCKLLSNAACATAASVTSTAIAMSVTSNVTPSVSLALTGGSNPICEGNNITVTATPVGGGSTPLYQWVVNNLNVGSNSDTYNYIPQNGDNIKVVMTTSLTCASASDATSSSIVMQVDQQPSAANAGPDQNINATVATLGATAPVVGSGSWTVSSGTGTFFSVSDPSTTVSGLTTGQNVFTWTVSNGTCPSASDDIEVNVSPNGIFGSQKTSVAYALYPNPFMSSTIFRVNTSSTEKMTITVKDMKGTILYTTVAYTNEDVELGRDLEAGLYIVEALLEDSVAIGKMKKAE